MVRTSPQSLEIEKSTNLITGRLLLLNVTMTVQSSNHLIGDLKFLTVTLI